ncbi:hypothetical protein IHN63_15480 [Deinococcus sp. 6YEL10]|uniref:DHHW family protein n=1 Tax=Deinococcus sp. 6YEL10 TaxID=2745870 RepID=UPI001E2F423C|nr:DHHW family protein [Deinococcus sp. 6YEL10]MCD0162690.1 hypothetical protein [Deinococcus sp. 6YEL10]
MKRQIATLAMMISSVATAISYPPALVGKDGYLFAPRMESYLPEWGGYVNTSSYEMIDNLKQTLNKKGIDVYVVIVPTKISVLQKYLPDEVKLSDTDKSRYDTITKKLNDRAVVNVPIKQILENQANGRSYFKQDTHWNPEGSRAAANALATAISNKSATLSKIPSLKISAKEQIKQSNPGDLVKLLPENQQAAYKSGEKFTSINFTKAEAGLLGDDYPDIVLLGSSYSSSNLGFADSLAYALQKDVLNVSMPANSKFGIWSSIEKYFNGSDFKSHVPKIVILEFPERDFHQTPSVLINNKRDADFDLKWVASIQAVIEKTR